MVIEPENRSAADERIVKAAIFPSIGVARVGSSRTEWFLGPEVPEPLPAPRGSYRDATGALKPDLRAERRRPGRPGIDQQGLRNRVDRRAGQQEVRLVRLSARP
jgi:hypothetical protein